MQETPIYEYALIRVVPQIERGECLNTGVILFCKRPKFLEMRYHIDAKRLSIFSEDLDLEELAGYLRAWDLICQGKREGGRIAQLDHASRFRWISAVKSTILQCSQVHPGMGTEPKALLDRLFEQYVR